MFNKKYGFLALLVVLVTIIGLNIQPNRNLSELKTKYTNQASQFMELQGMQVHYRDEGIGLPIVLLHGTGASLHTWDAWTEELSKEYRVIRMDLPAFGLTGPHPDRDYTLDTYVDFLNAFADKLELGQFYLAGNSLGGNIAWLFAARHPEKVNKLILLDPGGIVSGRKSPGVIRLARTPVFNQFIRMFTLRSLIKKNLLEVYAQDDKIDDLLIDRYFDFTLRPGNRQAFIDRAKTINPDYSALLTEIKCPSLIIWGAEDNWIPLVDGAAFQRAIPNAKLEVMESVGHVPMEEAPQESVLLVQQFLE